MIVYTKDSIAFSPYTSVIMMPNNFEHTLKFWKISYIISGEGIQKTNGVTRKLEIGDILIIKPGDIHQNISYIGKDYKHRDIYIFDDELKKICDSLPLPIYEELYNGPIFFKVKPSDIEEIEYLLSTFPINSKVKSPFYSSIHVGVIYTVLSLYLVSKKGNINKPRWLTELYDKCQNYECVKQGVSELIKDIPYCHGHICREFKKAYGITLIEHLNKARIVQSARMLMDKTLSITDISFELGFSSQSSFIKAFKKVYKFSPGVYRRNFLKNNQVSPTIKWGESNIE